MSAAADSCPVCFEEYNRSTRTKTTCPYCQTSVCRGCLQTYLLSENNVHVTCLNRDCGREWTRDFLDDQFTRTFRLGTYKEHRERVLLDRERARLPESQLDAEAMKDALASFDTIDREIRTLEQRLRTLETRKRQAQLCIGSYGRYRMTESGEEAAPVVRAQQRREFIRACPAEGCRGFLSQAWKCGLCDKWTCMHCHEVKGADKDADHTCDPDKVASAQLIERETRPCPKCGARITKLEGCNQMWCTVCNTGFDWVTGKIATGAVHNPHYFEWLARNGRAPEGGAGAAGAGLRPVAVGQMDCMDRYTADRTVARILSRPIVEPFEKAQSRYLLSLWRIANERMDMNAQNARGTNRDEEFRILRVRYLRNEIDEETWKCLLQRYEKEDNFRRAVQQVDEVFTTTVRELVWQVTQEDHSLKDLYAQAVDLVDYCNECFDKIAHRFARKVPHIRILSTGF